MRLNKLQASATIILLFALVQSSGFSTLLTHPDTYSMSAGEQMLGSVPNKPFNPNPPNGTSGLPTSLTLSVNVTDPDGDAMNVSLYQAAPPTMSHENFTIIALPDTQLYSANINGVGAAIFDNQTRWIVNNAESMNIVFVTHEGDIVDSYGTMSQWNNANHSLSLLDGFVPWAVLPGTHDGNPSNLANYETYFGYTRFNSKTWYGGAYQNNNANSYEFFSGGEDDYLIFHFQQSADDNVLAWANTTIENYPHGKVIVTTHDYMNIDGSRSTTGDRMWQNFVAPHSDQIFLILCGHNHAEVSRTDTVNGHSIYQLLADYQEKENGGDGWLRTLEFHPLENKVYVKTYSPYLNSYEHDADSEFTLEYNMTNTRPSLVGQAANVPSAGVASVQWNKLNPSTTHYWYAVAKDPQNHTTQSDTWSFTTAANFNLTLNPGWNMISFPVIPSNSSFSSIFSNVGYYQVLTWSGTSYVTPAEVEAGRGYWVLVLSETTVEIEGVPVDTYELDLPAGWSMIGSIYGNAVNAETVFQGFYQLLTWSGTSYVIATTIERGKGYWALVLEPTHILVD
jgi:hypothetical protein